MYMLDILYILVVHISPGADVSKLTGAAACFCLYGGRLYGSRMFLRHARTVVRTVPCVRFCHRGFEREHG